MVGRLKVDILLLYLTNIKPLIFPQYEYNLIFSLIKTTYVQLLILFIQLYLICYLHY